MFKNPENYDKNIADVFEGPPRIESVNKKMDNVSSKDLEAEQNSNSKIIMISDKEAHKVALSFLSKPEVVAKLKEALKVKLARNQNITRLDKALEGQELPTSSYEPSRKNLIENLNKNFLKFDLIQDGEDVAIVFEKANGDKAIRPLDNAVLAKILNKIILQNSHLQQSLNTGEKLKNI